MELWVVGKLICYETKTWEFQGVYSSKEKAINACIKDEYFIGPATLDSGLPDESVEWGGAYYPRLESK